MYDLYHLILAISCLLPGRIERSGSVDFSNTGYWAPAIPPRAHYTIDCRIDPTAGSLGGTEVIRFRNATSKPIHRLALDWPLVNQRALSSNDCTLEIMVSKRLAPILSHTEDTPLISPILFELPDLLLPEEQVELHLSFSARHTKNGDMDNITLTGWHPRLWWGFQTHDDFDVKVQASPEYTVAASGRLGGESGYYHAEDVRSSGLFLGKDLQVAGSNAGDVFVRCLFTSKGEECAQLLLTTAVDVINFYRERFGFYPYTDLTIIPGMDRPAGGYPVATGIVAIHGQERMSEHPEIHWQWITAHEIGHQYWGEYILEKDSPGWLWIGLGIYADREYVRARGLSLEKHQGIMARYIKGVRQGLNTTADLTQEQLAKVEFDFNNVVVHGKGYSIISALACLLGQETFDRIYGRCLKEFAGRRLGAHEFQAVCEEESQQDLGWFFNQWVRSNRYLSYQVTSQKCTKENKQYVSEVQVDCLGTLKMPVPVAAYFQDGTEQVRFTDRLLGANLLEFGSTTPLKEARLDPDDELALIVPPPSDMERKLREIPWTEAGKQALDLFNEAQEAKPADADFWGVLGLKVYDGKYYPEALEAFCRSADSAEEGSIWSFTSVVWQGHILDLLGRREESLQCYREALKRHTGQMTMRHDQYGLEINRQWVEERLEESFRGNWMDGVLPKMQKRVTPHFDIHYAKDSTAEREINQIIQERETGYQEIREFLGLELDTRICLVFFQDGESKTEATGHQGAGWAIDTTIVEVYNEQGQLDPYHEAVHILTRDYGDPPALFNEGFATYISERLGAAPLRGLGGGESSLYERVRELKNKGDWIPLKELLTYTDIGPSWSRPPISYAEAGAFVKFLIDAYGKEKFLEAYKSLKNSEDKAIHQQNQEKLEHIYGRSLDILRQGWYEAMGLSAE